MHLYDQQVVPLIKSSLPYYKTTDVKYICKRRWHGFRCRRNSAWQSGRASMRWVVLRSKIYTMRTRITKKWSDELSNLCSWTYKRLWKPDSENKHSMTWIKKRSVKKYSVFAIICFCKCWPAENAKQATVCWNHPKYSLREQLWTSRLLDHTFAWCAQVPVWTVWSDQIRGRFMCTQQISIANESYQNSFFFIFILQWDTGSATILRDLSIFFCLFPEQNQSVISLFPVQLALTRGYILCNWVWSEVTSV